MLFLLYGYARHPNVHKQRNYPTTRMSWVRDHQPPLKPDALSSLHVEIEFAPRPLMVAPFLDVESAHP